MIFVRTEDSLHLPRHRPRPRSRRGWAVPWVWPVLGMLLAPTIVSSSAYVQAPVDDQKVLSGVEPVPASEAPGSRSTDEIRAPLRIALERLQGPTTDRPAAPLQHVSLHDRPPSDPPAATGLTPLDSGLPQVHQAEGHTVAGALEGMECTGYPEPRIFIETQDWWVSTSGEQDGSGHVHVGTCFPYLQQVRGVVRFDLRVVMHENPGHLRRVDVAIYPADDSGLVVPVEFNKDCAGTCVFTAPVHIDTSTVSDGWQEFRFKARVDQPDGTEMLTSSGWKTYLANGNAVNGSDGGSGVTARGWYTDVGYQNAYIDALPAGPVTGTWTFTLKLVPGADGTPTTSHLIAVDPDFHHHDAGLIIKEGSGECRCTVSIDTTQLANGFHRLFLRSDSALATGITHSGVLAFAFEVRNP